MNHIASAGHYQLIEQAILLLEKANLAQLQQERNQEIRLSEIAQTLNLSPGHLQRVFADWAGISPKQFFHSLQKDHARQLLMAGHTTLSASTQLGLKSNSQLHRLVLKFEALTPGEIGNGGKDLCFVYGQTASPMGKMFVNLSPRGLNNLEFETPTLDYGTWLQGLERLYPKAYFKEDVLAAETIVNRIFPEPSNSPSPLVLHVRGTPFQLQVWEALVHLPPAQLASYQQLAVHLGKPNASRAVGSAIAKNSIAYLIPCHRVIQATGELGQYRWQSARKKALHMWEQGQIQQNNVEKRI